MCTVEYNQQKNFALLAVPCFSQAQNQATTCSIKIVLSLQHAKWVELLDGLLLFLA